MRLAGSPGRPTVLELHDVMHGIGEQAALLAVLHPELAERVGEQLPAALAAKAAAGSSE